MTAQNVREVVAKTPYENWVTIQRGIADSIVAEMSPEEIEKSAQPSQRRTLKLNAATY